MAIARQGSTVGQQLHGRGGVLLRGDRLRLRAAANQANAIQTALSPPPPLRAGAAHREGTQSRGYMVPSMSRTGLLSRK